MSGTDKIIDNSLYGHAQAFNALKEVRVDIGKIADACVATLRNGGKIIFMGNGGSAADAQHLAAELIGRFKKNRKPMAAMALSTNTSILTAIGNDFGFDDIFTRQIDGLVCKHDLVIGLSTSGDSKNIIKAIEKAKERGAKTAGFLGRNGGALKKSLDLALIVAIDDTPRIQEMHILAGHIICEIIESTLCPQS